MNNYISPATVDNPEVVPVQQLGALYDRASREGLRWARFAIRNGYVSKKVAMLAPYDGQWGIGYIIARHCDKNRVYLDYFVR